MNAHVQTYTRSRGPEGRAPGCNPGDFGQAGSSPACSTNFTVTFPLGIPALVWRATLGSMYRGYRQQRVADVLPDPLPRQSNGVVSSEYWAAMDRITGVTP